MPDLMEQQEERKKAKMPARKTNNVSRKLTTGKRNEGDKSNIVSKKMMGARENAGRKTKQ